MGLLDGLLGNASRIDVDKQGITGSKIEYHSLPYRAITHFSIELGRITIWQSNGQSDWIMSGRSPSDLAQLRSQVAHLWRRHA